MGLFLLPLVSAGSCYTALFPCELGFLQLRVGHCPRKIICGDSLRPRVNERSSEEDLRCFCWAPKAPAAGATADQAPWALMCIHGQVGL